MTTKVVDGDKYKNIKVELATYNSSAIKEIATLPFKSCVTTNFDRSMLDAIASTRGISPLDFRFGDDSFKDALWEEGLFVARIHGAAESPRSIVLSDRQFSSLLASDAYIDFLRACFINKNVLFIGFSFYDPAIRHVFNEIDRKFGSSSPGRHMALLPNDSSNEFITKANRLNIEVVKYDSANLHAELWQGIGNFKLPSYSPSPTFPFDPTRRYLAACLARARTQDHRPALREAVAEGIISAILQEAAPSGLTEGDLAERVRVSMGLKPRESKPLIRAALQALVDASLCLKSKSTEGKKYSWKGSATDDDNLEQSLRTLATSAIERAQLQEGWTAGETISRKLEEFFRHLIERRGWDLGAAFASGRAPEGVDVTASIEDANLALSTFDKERLSRVIETMLRTPTELEARLLSDLGRVSFALEMAFQSPQSSLVARAVLPRQIYFDASVLLPAIVDGHPQYEIYGTAIRKLKRASDSAAMTLNLAVCSVYLNEIISHKRNAEAFAREYGVGFEDAAHKDALWHGTGNSNVFVGAFANLRTSKPELSFNGFLKKYAPYTTESQLRDWIKQRGFNVIDAGKPSGYARAYGILERANAAALARGKTPILIEHDAVQLSRLAHDLTSGSRTIFVTADRQLRDAAPDAGIPDATNVMMSHVGLVQFIEMILGPVDGPGFSQLLWSPRVSDRSHAVRAYFTARALEQYNEGLAMAMPNIVEEHSDLAKRELERAGADIDSDNPKERARALKILGTLEDNYFKGMNAAVEKFKQGNF